jgi:hypothetical protein
MINNSIDFSKEYHEARKLMGTKGTDLDKLLKAVCYCYVYAPDEWTTHYITLIHEIEMRQVYQETGYFINTFKQGSIQ